MGPDEHHMHDEGEDGFRPGRSMDEIIDPAVQEANGELLATLGQQLHESGDFSTAVAAVLMMYQLAGHLIHVKVAEEQGLGPDEDCDGSCQAELGQLLAMAMLKAMRHGLSTSNAFRNLVITCLMALSFEDDDPCSQQMLFELSSKLAHQHERWEQQRQQFERWYMAEMLAAAPRIADLLVQSDGLNPIEQLLKEMNIEVLGEEEGR